jgi:hypothetical protein
MLLVSALGLLLLAGCGSNQNEAAADACGKAIADKLGGKSFSLDRDDMSARAKSESADVVAITSTIVFDKGLSTQYQQTFDCRVRLGSGRAADVIGLQFNWSKDDLKKATAG